MFKAYNLLLILLLSSLLFETADAFTIRAIRLVMKKASKYASSEMGERLTGKTVAKVLKNIDSTLGPLGLDYYVSMQEFANAAVRVGLNRKVGIAVYHVVDAFAGKK